MMPALAPLRAVWLMTRMRLTRQRNQIVNNLTRKKKKARDGNAGKRSGLWIMTLMLALIMVPSMVFMSRNAVLNLQCNLVADSGCRQVRADNRVRVNQLQAARELQAAPFDPAVRNGVTMLLSIALAIAVLLPLSGKELAKPDWDLEWLVTLPVERSTLLWGRLLERSASNPAGMLALIPPYLMVAWYSGLHWTALPAALLAAALLLPLAALLHTLIDTGLRMWLAAAQLRNLQAVLSLLSMPLLYLAMSFATSRPDGFAMQWARGFPAWVSWTPPGLVVQTMQAQTVAQFAAMAALLLVQTALLLWGGMALMRYQLRHGVVGSGARESARAKPAAMVEKATPKVQEKVAAAPGIWSRIALIMSPIQRRELRLLSRDRNFLVQTLLLPVIIVGSQLLLNGQLDTIGELGRNFAVAAAIAFGIGVYVLMLSAFQTLNNEGHSLWLLYTVPRSIETVLKEKALLWGALALAYPLIVLGFSLAHSPRLEWSMLPLTLNVLAGIPIYAMIAVALGVFACDPTAVEVQTRVRPTYAYLFMLLASFYTWSIYSDVWSQKLVVLVLSASLALALWQKARDSLPYLLDPAAAPPARMSTADGLIAATAFFVLQAVFVLIFAKDAKAPSMQAMTMAFAASGLLVYATVRLIYWRGKTTGVPLILRGLQPVMALRDAVIGAALACAFGLAYLYALKHSPIASQLPLLEADQATRLWIVVLAVVAAPLCEEFIFRGLIFGGLRRSMPAATAMLMSAAVFAVVHPPLGILPVFVVGLCTAWAYERSKTLLAPMLVHAIYNAAMMAAQVWSK